MANLFYSENKHANCLHGNVWGGQQSAKQNSELGFDPIDTDTPGLSQIEIKILADHISNKLLKIVEQKLKDELEKAHA